MRFVDLTGDGHADILLSEDHVLVWYRSLAEKGFAAPKVIKKPHEEQRGPALLFADTTQSVYLADMSGDGLTDIVRIRNGEVCYWPNLGYGRFGAKVAMDDAPWFDSPELFDQQRIRLADIDGSGVSDIIYLAGDGIRLYFNQSGNSWSAPRTLVDFPRVDDLSSVSVIDLLGNGTACIVWSSPLPCDAEQRMRYVDLMGGRKPHLLVSVRNNLGAETKVRYSVSTRSYLQDRAEGKPWVTRLPFPVHTVERVETLDWISRNRFVTRYGYHHGYYDGAEREFQGFGLVEQWDTEEIGALQDGEFPTASNVDAASYSPPVLTKTWFHTGAYTDRERISNHFSGLEPQKGGYYKEPGLTPEEAARRLLADTVVPDDFTAQEAREACRALKGSMLRREVYAQDGSARSEHPYAVTENNYTIKRVQPHGGSRHAVLFAHPKETIIYHYERNPSDPRVSHQLTIEVDEFGNVLKSAAVGYGRRLPDPSLAPEDQSCQAQTLITYTENSFTNSVDDGRAYRTPLPCDTRTYEITGLPLDDRERFSVEDLLTAGAAEASWATKVRRTALCRSDLSSACARYTEKMTSPAPLPFVRSSHWLCLLRPTGSPLRQGC